MKVVVHLTNKGEQITLNALRYEIAAGVLKVVEELEETSGLIASVNKTKQYMFSLHNVDYIEVLED